MSLTVFFVCSQILLIQGISGQCVGNIGAPWSSLAGLRSACGAPFGGEWAEGSVASLAASNGPGVAVSTASPRIPAGVSVVSENAYAGELAVAGALPFLGTVALEGVLPTAGIGAVAYGCGNGAVAITAEDAGVEFAGLGYGPGVWPSESIAASLAAAPWAAAPLAPAPYDAVFEPAAECVYVPAGALSASNGPGLAVTTVSSAIPAGVSVLSENEYEGAVAVTGALPFLGTVALEGALPTAGAGAVAYGCGNGAVGITAEDIGAVGFAGIAGCLGYGPGLAGSLGYGLAGPLGLAGPGCGCGAYY